MSGGLTAILLVSSLFMFGCKGTQTSLDVNPEMANQVDDSGVTPLIRASRQGNLTKIDYWISKGAYPNFADNQQVTPLMYASLYCNSSAVQMLLQHGARISDVDVSGQNVLHKAAIGGCTELIGFYNRKGLGIDQADKYDRSPLMLAAMNHRPEVTKLLLSKGAEPNLRDHKGRTPLYLSIMHMASPEVAPAARDSMPPQPQQLKNSERPPAGIIDRTVYFFDKVWTKTKKGGRKALHATKKAAVKTKNGFVKAGKASWDFMAHFPDHVREWFDKTPEPATLPIATKEDAMETIDILLEHGADPQIASFNGVIPLQVAREKQLFEVIKVLKNSKTKRSGIVNSRSD